MIFILTFSLLLGLLLSFFVLSPLLGSYKKIVLHSPKTPKKISEHLLQIKDQLFLKLAFGTCEDAQINSMSETHALHYLCDVCEKLQNVGVDWKPIKKESGSISLKFIFLLLVSCAVTLFAVQYSHIALADEENASAIPNDVVIPPPYILPDNGYWVPSVNQYILIPTQGVLHVFYVGMFSNKYNAKGTKILLPFPKNITDVSIHSDTNATLEAAERSTNNEIILNTPLKNNVNQIQAEFSLPASTGSAVWVKNSLSFLPGVTIIMSSKPAEITNFPKDFRSLSGNEIQFVRVGNSSSNFPEFNVKNIVPSRSYLYLLILFFACFFLAALFISILKLQS